MELSKDNFILFAMKGYIKPSCKTIIEFEEDLTKFSHLNRLCSKDMNSLETHILLNAIVTLFNLFEHHSCIALMFFKIKQEDWHKLKTVLVYMDRMPSIIPELNIKDEDIGLCQAMIDILRKM